jgi:sialate O-acetylesterase
VLRLANFSPAAGFIASQSLTFLLLAMKAVSLLACALLSGALIPPARANVSLPSLFSDHAVLQRDQTVPVWGWADPGEEVSVTFAGQTKSTKAGADGKWRVSLDKLQPGEPAALTVKGRNTITVADVLVGEVWLCSGQSNMAFTVNRAANFEQEKAAADHPQVRVFTVKSGGADTPQEKCAGTWVVSKPETVATFSAVAYFFARDLQAQLHVPCGVINSSVGGTPIESWTSREAQSHVPELKPVFAAWEAKAAAFDPEKTKGDNERRKAAYDAAAAKAKAEGREVGRFKAALDPRLDPKRPVNLFNGKIAPLIPFAIRGALWYQGESNATTAASGLLYGRQLPLMIEDWRKRWGYDFPFAWVQLPELIRGDSQGWCLVREAMRQSLKVPHTGMAIALGLGDLHNIHPTRKQEVAQRLVAWAMSEVYGQKTPWAGPLYLSHKIAGDKVTITFSHTDRGLVAKDGELKGFQIAGEDRQWKPATAKIEGENVVVSSSEVKSPIAVRYAWKDNPEFNLDNGAGLPASPFRTDDWPIADTSAPPRAKR